MNELAFFRAVEQSRMGVFTTSQLACRLRLRNPSAKVRLHRIAKRGTLVRIAKDVYASPGTHPFSIASQIHPPSYISLLAALQHHGATTQMAGIIDVINTTRTGRLTFDSGEGPWTLRFIKVEPRMMFGYERITLSSKSAFIATVEKTVVDGLALTGRIPLHELVGAMENGVDSLRLMDYAVRTGRQGVIKRTGHLLESLGYDIPKPEGVRISPTFVLLNPHLPRRGKYDARWRVVSNEEGT